MKKTLAALMATALILLATTNVQAETAEHKLGRGAADIVFGFLEIPANLNKETTERGGLLGFPVGLFKGAGMLLCREGVGVYEFFTAPIPYPGSSILEPEYPWDYFK